MLLNSRRQVSISAPSSRKKLETRKVVGADQVCEYAFGAGLELYGGLPKSAIETVVKCAVELEERVEVGKTELAFIVGEEMRDHEEVFEWNSGGGGAL
jgi:hypothetical protein